MFGFGDKFIDLDAGDLFSICKDLNEKYGGLERVDLERRMRVDFPKFELQPKQDFIYMPISSKEFTIHFSIMAKSASSLTATGLKNYVGFCMFGPSTVSKRWICNVKDTVACNASRSAFKLAKRLVDSYNVADLTGRI